MQTVYCSVALRRTWTGIIGVSFVAETRDSLLAERMRSAETAVWYVMFKRWTEITHSSRSAHVCSKILSNFLFHPEKYPPPPLVGFSSAGTCFFCTSVPVFASALKHQGLQAHTRSKNSFAAPCKVPLLQTVAMATTVHVWIKHCITAKASLLVLSISLSLSLLTLSLLLARPPSSSVSSTLQLSQNVQSGEQMKTFAMDCTRDAVCTLDLQQPVGAGRSGFSEALGHLWDLGTVSSQWFSWEILIRTWSSCSGANVRRCRRCCSVLWLSLSAWHYTNFRHIILHVVIWLIVMHTYCNCLNLDFAFVVKKW